MKKKTSVVVSVEAFKIWKAKAKKLGISQSAALEVIIRKSKP